jgi:hypothetical protein
MITSCQSEISWSGFSQFNSIRLEVPGCEPGLKTDSKLGENPTQARYCDPGYRESQNAVL